jgi:hypothetical protein
VSAFVVGINYPWVSCGHDFGPHPPAWGGDRGPRDWSKVEAELRELAASGMRVARFWILADGVNYPVGANAESIARLERLGRGRLHAFVGALAPALADRLPARGDYEMLVIERDLPPLGPAFVEDFRGLLRACRAAGVRLIPSLVSFELFQPAIRKTSGVIARGRARFVLDSPRRFFETTLEPLLEAAKDERDAIYAFEVMNEPEWVVREGSIQLDRPSYGWTPSLRTVDAGAMNELLAEGVERIEASGFCATIGFSNARPKWMTARFERMLRDRAARGTYVHQLHHYPTLHAHRTLAAHRDLPIRPCLVGEFPTAIAKGPENARWLDRELASTEADASRYLEARLELIRTRGYPGALLWSAHSSDTRKAFGEEERRQAERFCDGLERA